MRVEIVCVCVCVFCVGGGGAQLWPEWVETSYPAAEGWHVYRVLTTIDWACKCMPSTKRRKVLGESGEGRALSFRVIEERFTAGFVTRAFPQD